MIQSSHLFGSQSYLAVPAVQPQSSCEDCKDPLKDPTSPESKQLRELQARDREVRAHEQAHLAAGGQHVTSGPHYEYQRGPDNKLYAVGGEVGIDTSPVSGDAEATLRKMQQIQGAALAPSDPSGQDRAVAAQAAQQAAKARAELAKEQTEGSESSTDMPELFEAADETEGLAKNARFAQALQASQAEEVANLLFVTA